MTWKGWEGFDPVAHERAVRSEGTLGRSKPHSKPRSKAAHVASKLESALLQQIALVGLPMPEREVTVIVGRRFRADLCWPAQRVIAECEGGVWTEGRHSRGAGYTSDCEKYNLLALDGWTVIRATADHIRSGKALAWIAKALAIAESTLEV